MKRNLWRLSVVLRNTGVAMLLIVLLYGAAGMIGGVIPSNLGWSEPRQGVRIYIEDNGIHTGITMPLMAEGVDWRGVMPPGDLRDPRFAGHRWRSFGWGDRTFYLDTPTWGDVNVLTVARAAIGSSATVMHVEAVPEPRVGVGVRSVVLRPDEYRRLAAFVRAAFAEPREHRFGYGGYDAFYTGRGHYSAIRTCNAWTGDALRAAGVRMGAWTPFPVTVMGWLPAN